MPADARASLIALTAYSIEKQLMAQHRTSEASKRIVTIPGIGVIDATAVTATLCQFRKSPMD